MAPPRKSSDQQIRELLDFMEKNPDIARSKVSTKNALLSCWTQLARKLNVMGHTKSPAQWRTYWSELKYSTKQKAMKIKKSIRDCENVRLPKFTEIEVRVLAIIGLDVPKRPRSPIPIVSRKTSQSGVAWVAERYMPASKREDAVGELTASSKRWDSLETKSEQEYGGNSEDVSCQRLSEDINVLSWARRLEKRRIDGEHRIADAMQAIAKSQADIARSQLRIVDALNGISNCLQLYLRPESHDPMADT